MCIYVDDLIITRNLEEQINYLKKEMKSMFEMTDLGSMKYFLSMEVIQCQMGIFLSQEKYAKELLKKFQTTLEKLVLTPMNINEKIEKEDLSISANWIEGRKQYTIVHISQGRGLLTFDA